MAVNLRNLHIQVVGSLFFWTILIVSGTLLPHKSFFQLSILVTVFLVEILERREHRMRKSKTSVEKAARVWKRCNQNGFQRIDKFVYLHFSSLELDQRTISEKKSWSSSKPVRGVFKRTSMARTEHELHKKPQGKRKHMLAGHQLER